MATEIYLGLVESCPSPEVNGRFAYHIVIDGESSIANLDYRVPNRNSLVGKLKTFSKQEVIVRNGIPKNLSEGYAHEFKFQELPNDILSSIISESGLEDLTSAA